LTIRLFDQPEGTAGVRASVEAVGKSELLLELEQTVGRLPPSGGVQDERNEDGSVVVTAVKLRQALRHRWLASELSHVILKYESEWSGNMSRWEALTANMRNAAENWTCELERIKNLQWWDSVTDQIASLPASPQVNHIHPIAILGNFTQNRRRRDFDLGKLSSQYETSGRGPAMVSGGQGDPGGASYGSYQMTSKTLLTNGVYINGGVVKDFIESTYFPWTSEFAGLPPGTPLFSEKWRAIVAQYGDEFSLTENTFIKNPHYDVQVSRIFDATGVDLRYHSHTLNDVVWSTAVQHGPTTNVVINAMGKVGIRVSETKAYDKALINAIYDERGKTNAQGKLLRFIHSSDAVQAGIKGRYISERSKAQAELDSEIDY